MDENRRIAKYTSILTASGILCKILLIFFVSLAFNLLGEAVYGRLEYLIEIGLILGVLFDFGFEQTLTRDLSGRPQEAHDLLWGFWIYRLGISCLLLLTYLGVVVFFFVITHRPIEWFSIALGALVAVMTYHIAFTKALLRSQERLVVEARMNIAEKIVTTGLGSIVILWGYGLAPVVSTYLAGAIVSLSIGLWTLTRLFPGVVKQCNWHACWLWQSRGMTIGLSAACILMLHREDTVMVNLISGDDATGIYRAPYRYFEGLFLVPQMLAISAYPIISAMYAQNRSFHDLTADLLRFLLVLAIPMAVGGTVLGGAMMQTLLPSQSHETSIIFVILVWSLPPIFLNFVLGTVLNAVHRQHRNFQAAGIALISNFIFNIPAIYWYEGAGASVTTIISQGLYCLLCLTWAREFIAWSSARIWTCAAACLASGIMALVLAAIPFHWLIEVPLGAAVYGAALLLLRAFSPHDIQRLRHTLGRPSPVP